MSEDIYECQGFSIEHADGSTECMDFTCDLPHELHSFHVPCIVAWPIEKIVGNYAEWVENTVIRDR